jgi:Tfp pilus assembly protein PilO
MKLPKAKYHLPLGVIAAGSVLLVGAVLPHTRRLGAVHAECTGLRTELAAHAAQVQTVGAAARTVATGRERLAVFDAAIPRGKQLGELLSALDGFAQAHGLRDLQLRPTTEMTGGPVQCLPIEVEFFGDFEGAYAFLNDVERLPRIAWVQRFELAHAGELEQGLRGALTLLVYYRPEAEDRP